MKEYWIKDNKTSFKLLKSPGMAKGIYKKSHEGLVIPCHDVFINYRGGLLLVTRDRSPARGLLWPIGGRIKRGLSLEESIRQKAREECNLKLGKLIELGCARVYANSDPFDHGKGTDNIAFIYFAKGYGKLKLDGLHSKPMIISPIEYTRKFRDSISPYVRDFMDIAMKKLSRSR